eukprot:TRINITY_DN54751_c0_g1_i1.p1 TRINITY_DN54751_c0_g1~~TRINITY_DN54751_c0_g1_i1.p1  ORF type:complete len:262 (+),score=16.29 TRINITY_DN54751_c0_g1_i1:3-788(+)
MHCTLFPEINPDTKCGTPLGSPTNGAWRSSGCADTPNSGVCVLDCDVGFSASEGGIATCINGQWQNSAQTCVGNTCKVNPPAPPGTANGAWVSGGCANTVAGGTCQFVCDSGFWLSTHSDGYADCAMDGFWTDFDQACLLNAASSFTTTSGVVHTAAQQTAAVHHVAVSTCASLEAHVCASREYAQAGLGWVDNTNPYAEDHLFWSGSTAWNSVTSCTSYSCNVGATCEAGSHTGNAYVHVDYTACSNRCDRALPYYCCRG